MNVYRITLVGLPQWKSEIPEKISILFFIRNKLTQYWVMPSLQLIEEANQNKEGVNKGKYSINFCNVTTRGATPRPRFKKYENSFELLDWMNDVIPEQRTIPNNVVEPISPTTGIDLPKAQSVGQYKPSCWDEIKKLEGQTINTLAQYKKFKILNVTEKIIIIKINATGKERRIYFKKEIAAACKALKTRKRLTRIEIEDEFAPRNPAFVAAILAKLPQVHHVVKPVITLFYD